MLPRADAVSPTWYTFPTTGRSVRVFSRVLVTGDRTWTDGDAIRHALWPCRLMGTTTVILGGTREANDLAGMAAADLGLAVERYGAGCPHCARGAGRVRNQRMLDQGKPDLVVYFHDDLDASWSTGDMVRRATKAGVEVRSGRFLEEMALGILGRTR